MCWMLCQKGLKKNTNFATFEVCLPFLQIVHSVFVFGQLCKQLKVKRM